MRDIVLRALLDLEAWPAVAQHNCRFSFAIWPVLGRRGFMPRMPLVAHEEAMVSRVENVILRRLLQLAAVRNDGGFLQKSLSALGDQCWSKMGGTLRSLLFWSQGRTRRESC